MRVLMVFLILAAVVATASAGGNPAVRCYIDFDHPNRVHTISPEPGTTVDAYICLDFLDMGMTGLSFRLTDVMSECPGVFSSYSFENLLAGGITVGDPLVGGCSVAAPECTGPGTVCVGVVHFEYVDGDCCIKVEDHINVPRWVVDCSDPGVLDLYRTGCHGSVGSACCPSSEDCMDVRCEPQGPENPSHPPTYWYDVGVGYLESVSSFRVRVEDPDPANYTNWVAPYQWSYGLEQEGDETWAVWRQTAIALYSGFRFQFDHSGLPTWSHWELQSWTGTIRSADMPAGVDGCGYRVHVPAAATPVEQASWGTIKALFR